MNCCVDCKYWEPDYNKFWSSTGCQGWCINSDVCGKYERVGRMNYMPACSIGFEKKERTGIMICGNEETYNQFVADVEKELTNV